MNYELINNLITPDKMISLNYDMIKNICHHIWEKTKCFQDFEDVFHYTIQHCLEKLDRTLLYEEEYLKAYIFKSFRINMIRFYKYACNRFSSDIDISDLDVSTTYNIDDYIDSMDMLEHVRCQFGQLAHNLLLDNLIGMTYKDLDKLYNINSYYVISKIKTELKTCYKDYQIVHSTKHKNKTY